MTQIPTLAAIAMLTASGPCLAQTDPNPALNAPDKQAWTLFLTVNADAKTAGNNNAFFETWASDGDTFRTTPACRRLPSRSLFVLASSA
jgi:hypothetical protein